ncbi:MAG: P-loop NTPase [Candidatus Palauibacterales bacterium]|nr:P-loop NTPase [Candidatus Palauibacterales bacterium]
MSDYDIRTYAEVEGEDRSDLAGQVEEQRARVTRRMEDVDRILAVMSGKGGVGKSYVAASLAAALADRADPGRVGLLDADLDAPTADRMLGAPREPLAVTEGGVEPAAAGDVRLISTGLLLEEEAPLAWREPDSESFVWRGAQEHGVLREFLGDVSWGELAWLVVDLPPGSGRLEQLLELVPGLHAAVAVTLPTGASRSAVERSLRLVRSGDVPVAGVVENMSSYACGDCGSRGPLFPGEAGRELAERFDLPLLGTVPFDPRAAELADRGETARALRETAAGRELSGIADRLESPGEQAGRTA